MTAGGVVGCVWGAARLLSEDGDPISGERVEHDGFPLPADLLDQLHALYRSRPQSYWPDAGDPRLPVEIALVWLERQVLTEAGLG